MIGSIDSKTTPGQGVLKGEWDLKRIPFMQ
jgi:hypothetical protein